MVSSLKIHSFRAEEAMLSGRSPFSSSKVSSYSYDESRQYHHLIAVVNAGFTNEFLAVCPVKKHISTANSAFLQLIFRHIDLLCVREIQLTAVCNIVHTKVYQ